MAHPTKVLLIEDVPVDADLAIRQMRKAGLEIEPLQVASRIDLEFALYQFVPDLILSDYSLPGFSGLEALQITRQTHPDTPFIFLSGTIGEERAIEALKHGATDYVLKDSRGRLVPAIERALSEHEALKMRRKMESDLGISLERFRNITEATGEWIWEADTSGAFTYCNPITTTILGYSPEELIRWNTIYLIREDWQERVTQFFQNAVAEKQGWHNQLWPWRSKDGTLRWLESSGLPLLSPNGRVIGFRGSNRDVTERIQQQEKINRLSRIHSVLSGISSTIIRVRDRQELFREVCHVALNQGGFSMAWIGLAGPQNDKFEPAAWSGSEEIYRSEVKAGNRTTSIKMFERVLKGKKAVVDNHVKMPLKAPLKVPPKAPAPSLQKSEPGSDRSQSIAALPLLLDGEVIGVMVLYAAESGFFDENELKLLKQLAADISFGFYHLAQLERLAYLSHYDTLTGLANRQLFSDRLTQIIKKAHAENVCVAVMVFDLQQFRNLNDTLGRGAGDSLLKEIANRLLKIFGETATPARLSGDRFAVAITNLKPAALATRLDDKIINLLSRPFEFDGVELRPNVKIGIAYFPEHGMNTEAVFMNAEAALQHAKDTTDVYVFYAREINEGIGKRLHFENRLRKAVEHKQFQIHYQTKVDLATKKIQGLEALIRWRDPDHGPVSPAEFIPLLEETGLIIEVGYWVLDQVISDIHDWQALKIDVPRVAINVSQLQLRKKNFVPVVLAKLGLFASVEEIGFDPAETIIPESILQHPDALPHQPVGIDLEITESFIAKDVEANVKMLRQLRTAGLKIHMDDFGTGYSSLSQITELPLDSLKIDRSFIASMTQSSEHMAIVSNIINLARTLKIAVIAEGVETEEQARLLEALGCDQAQGYLFNHPVSAIEIAQILWANSFSSP